MTPTMVSVLLALLIEGAKCEYRTCAENVQRGFSDRASCEADIQKSYGVRVDPFLHRVCRTGAERGCIPYERQRSWLETSERSSVPSDQRWSVCRGCGWDSRSGTFVILEGHGTGEVLLAKDQWSEFWKGRDHIRAQQTPFNVTQLGHIISVPVFIIHILTFHIGHLITDVLEQLYHAMLDNYGEVNTDCILVLDVSNREEQPVLFEKIMRFVYEEDSPMRLLRLFTHRPMFTLDSFVVSLPAQGIVIFSMLHVGMDLRLAHFNHGHDIHPQTANLSDPYTLALARKYRGFRHWLFSQLHLDDSPLPPITNTTKELVTVLHRLHSRVVDTIEVAADEATAHGFKRAVVDIGDLTFTKQLELLQSTSVLVGSFGTGMHNVIFMRPNSAIVLLTQPDWCDWRWFFVNQAALLGIHSVTYCHASHETATSGQRHHTWSVKGWREGPRSTKDMNYTVPSDLVRIALRTALNFRMQVLTEDVRQDVILGPAYPQRAEVVEHFLLEHAQKPVDMRALVTRVRTAATAEGYAAYFLMELLSSLPPAALDEQVPQLELCTEVGDMIHCYPITFFDYYANVTFTGPGGAYFARCFFRDKSTHRVTPHSDTVIVYDLSLPNGGFDLLNEDLIGSEFHVSVSLDGMTDASLRFRIWNAWTLQHLIADSSTDLNLSLQSSHLFAQSIYNLAWKIVKQRKYGLPAVQRRPMQMNPFIFVHVEKCGGTSLRRHFYESAQALNLSVYIPYHDPEDPVIFDVPKDIAVQRPNLSVIAGHFYWGSWRALPQSAEPEFDVTCLVMLRHPVSRTISYYYQRLYPENPVPLNDLTPEVLHEKLLRTITVDSKLRYSIDDGPAEAACRTLSGKQRTRGMKVGKAHAVMESGAYEPPDPALALHNQNKCIVGVVEYWLETVQVLEHFLPWIGIRDSYYHSFSTHTNATEVIDTLNPTLLQKIVDVNPCDMMLYAEGLKRFQLELEVARDRSFMAVR